jgi:hypothetical protein
MVDRYTQAVLTVIAASLVALVGQNTVQSAKAQMAQCGDKKSPCYVAASRPFYVEASPKQPLYVTVNPNEPMYVMTPPLQALTVKLDR